MSGAPGNDFWKLGLFQGLCRAAISKLQASAGSRLISAGSLLFKQGEAATHLYVVREGCFKVLHLTVGGTQVGLGFVLEGELLGGAAAMLPTPFAASAYAVRDSTVSIWTKPLLDEIGAGEPALFGNLLRIVCASNDALVARLGEQLSEPVEQRVARTIRRLARVTKADALALTPPISRQDIADLTGTTHFTVSRILRAWERRGLIASRRPCIAILDAACLLNLSEGGRAST